MKRIFQILLAGFVLVFVDLYGQANNPNDYQKGIEAIKLNDIPVAEKYFMESIRNNKDAASFHAYGNLLLVKNTFESRQLALENLKEAALREPRNIEYNLAYASFLEQMARKSAKTKYREMVSDFPDRPEPLIGLGRLMLEDYYEWKNSKKYSGLPNPEDDYDLSEYVADDFDRAEGYLKKALEIEPNSRDACYEISRLYINSSMLPSSIPYLKRMCAINPVDSEPHLYLGMVYNRMGELNDANVEFGRAIDLMNEEERSGFVYGSMVKLLNPKYDVEKKYKSKEEIEKFITRFWKVSNPLKLSGKNQRLLEHYSRMAYANLHFSLPLHNIIGWKTDRGEVVLRYGIPITRTRIRPTIINYPKNESWQYDGFSLTFDDNYMNMFKLSDGDLAFHFNPRSDYSSHSKFEMMKSQNIQSFQPKGIKLTLQSKLFRFKSLDAGRTNEIESYLTYTLPTQSLSGFDDIKNSSHAYGIFLYDDDFLPLFEKTGKVTNDRVKKISMDEKNLERIDNIQFISPAKPFTFSFEVMKLSDSTYYSAQTYLPAPEQVKEGLDLSGIVFASAVDENEEIPGAIKRNKISVLPNITGSFRTNEPTYLYYEIYGLEKGKDGLADFEQMITIKEHVVIRNEGTLLGTIINAVTSILSKNAQVSLTSAYHTKEVNPQQYIQLDLSKYYAGLYDVTITIQDKVSGKTSKKTETIKIWGLEKKE